MSFVVYCSQIPIFLNSFYGSYVGMHNYIGNLLSCVKCFGKVNQRLLKDLLQRCLVLRLFIYVLYVPYPVYMYLIEGKHLLEK